jgi:hypothetical protein
LFEAPVGVELGALPVPEAFTPEPSEEPLLPEELEPEEPEPEEPEPEEPPAANDISLLLGVVGHEKTHCQLV